MKNIQFLKYDIEKKFDKEINFDTKDLNLVFDENFDNCGDFREFKNIITNLFNTGDRIIIRGSNIYYNDYNDFDWEFTDDDYVGGLIYTLQQNDYVIKKVKPGHLVVEGIDENFIFETVQDFDNCIGQLPYILAEICRNIYHYEYIEPVGFVNLYNDFYGSKRHLESLYIGSDTRLNDVLVWNHELDAIDNYVKHLRQLEDMGYFW